MFRVPTVIVFALALAAPAVAWGGTTAPDEGTVATVGSAPSLERGAASAPAEKTVVDQPANSSEPKSEARRPRYGSHDASYRLTHPYGVPPQVLPFIGIPGQGF